MSLSKQTKLFVMALLVSSGVFFQSVAAQQADESLAVTPPQVAQIDSQIVEVWDQFQLTPSNEATDGEWCRRLFLDLIGRIPTVSEVRSFVADRSPDKRAALVDRLLHDEEYVEDFARNWTTHWTNLLLGRTGGTDDGDLANRAGMQKYLRDSFAREKRYDRLVYELITAEGDTVPGSEEFNGAVNFLVNKLDENAAQATAKTSQLFLGMQVQCTQCHNHPFNEWKQNQFWEMNAFFRQTRALRRFEEGTNDIRFAKLINQDFGGEGATPENAEIYYEQRNGLLKSAYPVFVDGAKIDSQSGFVSDVNRRGELAKMVLKSEYLSLAAVNRMWGHFLGYGFTKPVDDMGPHNDASHPQLLAYLAAEFRNSEYDLKSLIKWIVLSRPYALSSRSNSSNVSDDPQLGVPPKFSKFYLRQMRAEELYESLLVATRAHETRGSYEEQEALKARWLRQFNIAFGTDEGDDTTTFNGSIPQVLMMFNGDMIKKATSSGTGSFLSKIAANEKVKPAKKVEYLYMAALARKPTQNELRVANKLLAFRASDYQNKDKKGGNRRRPRMSKGGVEPTTAALQDIWWVLLNSNEFIMNH
ncbi:MAG: DUF1549 domain-containing protein [Planctomycetota bacterium]